MPDQRTAHEAVASGATGLDRLAPQWWRHTDLDAVTAGDLTAVTPNAAAMPDFLRDKLPSLGLVELPGGPTAHQLAKEWATRIANRRANRARCTGCGQEFAYAVTPDGHPVRIDPHPGTSGPNSVVLDGDVDDRPTVVLDIPPGDPRDRHDRHTCPEMPRAAAQLLDTARAAGWRLLAVTHHDTSGHPYLKVQVAHPNPPAVHNRSGPCHCCAIWAYEVTWHTRGTGSYRLFGRVLARVPGHAAPHDGPSIRAIRTLIDANPAKGPHQ
ncbi:hypothetical protein OOJ91_34070 [Micromonospora lupini]|uniref:hypothetical protein n=1 Tax=Micromonospora lupini TaxID=285679 RepID=UPI00224F47E8|nr:hypothetical protein [Micromonospora lupini]MCX5070876.1 hypothetical protein [Micromonospora lupini]